MKTFKVICKANCDDWRTLPGSVVTIKRFFGLFKSQKTVYDKVPGPAKEEICIVTETYTTSTGIKCYILAGYPYGGYDSKYFIKLDEFTETQKEIAKKTEPVLN